MKKFYGPASNLLYKITSLTTGLWCLKMHWACLSQHSMVWLAPMICIWASTYLYIHTLCSSVVILSLVLSRIWQLLWEFRHISLLLVTRAEVYGFIGASSGIKTALPTQSCYLGVVRRGCFPPSHWVGLPSYGAKAVLYRWCIWILMEHFPWSWNWTCWRSVNKRQ